MNTPTRETGRSATGVRMPVVAAIGSCAILWAAQAAAEVRFTPRLSAEVTYTDNVELDPPGSEQDETVLHLAPGFRLTADSDRLEGDLQYELGSYLFLSESDFNETFHQLEADAHAEVLRELFFVDLSAQMGRTVIDPELQIPTSNVTQSANRTDTASWSVRPSLRRSLFRGTVDSTISYEYGQIEYRDDDLNGEPLEDLENEVLTVRFERAPERGRLGWSAEYERQELNYDFDPDPLRYARAEANVEYPITSSLALLGRGGAESDLTIDQISGSLDEGYWQAGFRWVPSLRHRLSVLAGERFYGNAYEAEYEYTGRVLRGALTYSEQPTTQALDLARRRIFITEPGDIDPVLAPVTPDLFLSKGGNAWLTITGRRNLITLQAYRQKREYLATGLEETEAGGNASWTYRLGPRTTADVAGGVIRTTFRAGERADYFVTWSVALRRQIGPRTSVDLTFRHFQRDSDEDDPDIQFLFYREDAVTLGLRFALP